ncbi:hypothetical protein L6164_001176 [Bauhinia variegata]|uniref:Uncharacterized protein n=1 Tax=Bauhinia variegata TaxID=167791 RepID=A0ACB9Q936_BAUVA|nr:hypothetical protein L6164_001176 [Bauhinia variegata]
MAYSMAKSRFTLASDESSLLAFKSSMNLDTHDLLANNWSSSSSLCNWIGITCDALHGRVKVLNLNNMGLIGKMPPELGNLSFLSKLDLSNNNFYGELPNELQRLHRVKLPNLSHDGNEFLRRFSSTSTLESPK